MTNIKVLQVGLGPLGLKVAEFIKNRKGIKTVAAVDRNPKLVGQSLSDLRTGLDEMIIVQSNPEEALEAAQVDVAILTTVSDMQRITNQIEQIVRLGIPVVSTCEELAYPWDISPKCAQRLDDIAKSHQVAIVGTGVNPGFMMDALPTFLTAVCQEVSNIEVKRIQDAQYRRLPFQRKIGAGLTIEEFELKKKEGTLRHVGLTESMQLIAHRMGWHLDRTEDVLEPVIAQKAVHTKDLSIQVGQALGVRQIGRAYLGEELKILLTFQAAVGALESYDEVRIHGTPMITSRIAHGVNGDIATCAIAINAIPQLLRCTPGLKTMGDIPLVSFFSY
ncbi:MAG: dihydrodipicolinate reductase [Bacteroidota bacterium]